MDSKLAIGVHLCDKSDLYKVRQLQKYESNRDEVRFDAVKLLDLSDFTVCDLSIEECHKLGYKFYSFSDGCNVKSDKYIFSNIEAMGNNSLFGSSKIGNLYECGMPIYYNNELVYENNDRILELRVHCCTNLGPNVIFWITILVDLIDYRVQCKTANGFNIYGDFDLASEHEINHYYRYESGVVINSSMLLPSLYADVNKDICTFSNEIAIVSLKNECSYIIPSGLKYTCLFGFGDKSNIVLPISLNEVYLSWESSNSYIKFLVSSGVSNAFLKRLYKSTDSEVDINKLFDRESILKALKSYGMEIEFY